MAIFKFSNAGGFGTFTRYNDFLAGNLAVVADKGSMYPLGVFTLSANQTTISFTNIPQTYTHLQLRIFARQAGSWSEGSYFSLRMNSDSGNNYASHHLRGIGSGTPTSSANTSSNLIFVNRITNASQGTSIFGASIIDILDYRNVNKNKTIRYFSGFDNNGSGEVAFGSGLWMNSSTAVSSLQLGVDTGDFVTNSTFTLYGVQA